ncbi:MAG: electron transfer flavoprotein subunit beta/FixA family protein [Chloroflexi bacterium]|nr:electron transfer flavoprotein subunit beta/FixA family protein [Chloroflexota bacterium]
MRIVVLAKPVPDTTGTERLGDDLRLDRLSSPPIVNPNDEYAVEQAIRLVEAHGGEITLLTMAPPGATETMRKALAMGAHGGLLVTDDALAGACALATTRVLAAALATLDHDLVLAGAASADGGAGVVAAGIAAIRGLPYLSYAGSVEVLGDRVRIHRLHATGYTVLEAPLPAFVVVTQMVGEPRYASLKGIMAARSRQIRSVSLADLGLDPAEVGGSAATTRVLAARRPAERGATRVVRGSPAEVAREIVDLLDERRLL